MVCRTNTRRFNRRSMSGLVNSECMHMLCCDDTVNYVRVLQDEGSY